MTCFEGIIVQEQLMSGADERVLGVDGNQGSQMVVASLLKKVVSTTSGSKRNSSLAFEGPEEQQRSLANAIALELEASAMSIRNVSSLQLAEEESPFAFESAKPLTITLSSYVNRLIRYLNKWAEESDTGDSIGATVAVAAVVLLKRSKVHVQARDLHQAFLAAFSVAMKLIYDFYVSNKYFANVGGVSNEHLYALESAMCAKLNWDFAISPDAIEQQKESCLNRNPSAA